MFSPTPSAGTGGDYAIPERAGAFGASRLPSDVFTPGGGARAARDDDEVSNASTWLGEEEEEERKGGGGGGGGARGRPNRAASCLTSPRIAWTPASPALHRR